MAMLVPAEYKITTKILSPGHRTHTLEVEGLLSYRKISGPGARDYYKTRTVSLDSLACINVYVFLLLFCLCHARVRAFTCLCMHYNNFVIEAIMKCVGSKELGNYNNKNS